MDLGVQESRFELHRLLEGPVRLPDPGHSVEGQTQFFISLGEIRIYHSRVGEVPGGLFVVPLLVELFAGIIKFHFFCLGSSAADEND